MAMYYSDLYSNLLSRAVLEPGEVVVGKARAVHAPWYTKFMVWLKREILLVATNKRLLVFHHRRGFFRPMGLASTESHSWSSVSKVAPKGLFGTSLMVASQNVKETYKLTFSDIEKPSKGFAASTVKAWETGRALPATTQARN